MARFSYAGVTFSGQTVSGVLNARDEAKLRTSLREQGVLLVDSRPVRARSPIRGLSFTGSHNTSVTRYFRHLATLLGAGVPLSKALDGLAERAQGSTWKDVARDIADRVKNGASLTESFSDHDDLFSGVVIPMVSAGERSGHLADVLEEIADYREKSETVGRKVKGALVYPMVVSFVALIVIWIMLSYVVPTFSEMFSNLGAELPKPTRVLLDISRTIRFWGPVLGILLITLLIAAQAIRFNPAWRLKVSRTVLRIPVLGETLARIALSRLSRTASALLGHGVPLVLSLRTAAKTAGNSAIECAFLNAAAAVEQGRPLSEPLRGLRIIPPLASQILSTGEETANLGQMFGKLATFYENESDAAIGVVTSVLEPALVVVMGIVVAAILIALYLPMFDVLGQIG